MIGDYVPNSESTKVVYKPLSSLMRNPSGI